jgi:hypothetical protein
LRERRVVNVRIYDDRASEEFKKADHDSRGKASVLLKRMFSLSHIECTQRLQSTSLENVFQDKLRVDEGALRLVYAWGPENTLWLLGAFVKPDNPKGNKLLASHAGRAVEAKTRKP